MKKLKLTCFLVLYLHIIDAQVITSLKIYYLPWRIRPDAMLEAEDVRDFNHGKNSYYHVEDTMIINEFEHAMSIFYLRPFPELKIMDHVMVIDIYFKDGNKETIGLNTRKNLVFSSIFYHTNFELEKWIDKYVPPAKNP